MAGAMPHAWTRPKHPVTALQRDPRNRPAASKVVSEYAGRREFPMRLIAILCFAVAALVVNGVADAQSRGGGGGGGGGGGRGMSGGGGGLARRQRVFGRRLLRRQRVPRRLLRRRTPGIAAATGRHGARPGTSAWLECRLESRPTGDRVGRGGWGWNRVGAPAGLGTGLASRVGAGLGLVGRRMVVGGLAGLVGADRRGCHSVPRSSGVPGATLGRRVSLRTRWSSRIRRLT